MTAHRSGVRRRDAYEVIKRCADVVGSGLGLLITAPVQVAVALVIRARLGSPVLFRQRRPGRHGEVFTMIKFRTMRLPGASGAEDADRLTELGRLLRSTSLDELPSLWNVLKGDMSLVGPRPLLVQYLTLYGPEEARRHEVRPGITGLAQVSGRNGLGWAERFALDVHYVDHRSAWLDIKIIARTLGSVLRRTGISADGHATVPPFTGAAAG